MTVMQKSFARLVLPAALTLLLASPASATVIDFNSLPAGTLITNQFPGVTFSSEAGQGVYAHAFSLGIIACTGTPSINCQNDVYVDFATPVSNLSVIAVEPNNAGIVATFFLYSGATLLGTQDLPGLDGSGNVAVNLGAFANVTRLEMRGPGGVGQLDLGSGIGWDNLSFDAAGGPTAVPEPGTLALLSIGALAIARRVLRRPSKDVPAA